MDVQHDPNRHRFFLEVSGGTAELSYRRLDEHTVDLVHTAVPDAAAGQGIAGKLAKAAFAWARQNGVKLVATCPFVRKWLERHPDERDLVIVPPGGG
ncbi:MAG TPA: GNAT family N-acetyltransferase [Myxococcaceae bacterium]|nr:GNAT family N-acetyltransferase [Myxococcaceae bacterium]